ncbi:MAG TPA: GntR family transcriptional regulator [Anaerolineaceae bacterium]|jgi:DNA-binding GntR family transcriptional regulator|nr:GntR family transcriptional regulator [Anaerolineaceae bacterium]
MLNYQSLKDLVYDYISEQITTGKLKPNESISENSICTALDVSRTPVREALMQLSNEGYIEHIPRRGFFVRPLTLERVHNIYGIIGSLEALGAVLALDSPKGIDFVGLRHLAQRMDEVITARQYDEYHRLQYQFHECLLQASGNDDLIRLVVNLKKFFMRQDYPNQPAAEDIQTVLHKTNAEHWHIIHLLEAGDRDAVRTFIQDIHWNVIYATLDTFV